jgi:membrane peptidoglycan carboxypeptidase
VADAPHRPRGRSGKGAVRVWIGRLLAVVLLLGALGVLALAGLYWQVVVVEDAPHIEPDAIRAVIAQESPVFYADGETKLGVFFSEQHRQYVAAADLPEDFVRALVSAEDRTFFSHRGVSPRGIARAMVQNLRAGRTVAGGSTLTQQTAKNLFERTGRTYKEKLRELANALRLERRYSKREILEFYSNQFYVNGNGRGLGIAARFFFDAEVADLDLLECAFLAGVVKSPNRYNPFVADEARRARALAAGEERVGYVLGRMLQDGWIDQATHDREVARAIPFKRGRFRFERSVVLDYVEQELNSAEFRATLQAHGVDDPGRAGLRVVTTLSAPLQREAVYALRHQLSDVGLWLEAPSLEALFGEPRVLPPVHREELARSTFHTGLLGPADVEAESVQVSLGGDQVGVLDREAHARLATALLRGKDKNTWVEAKRKDRKELVARVAALGSRSVTVSVRGEDEAGGLLLDYEPPVELQGAVVVLDDGEVRAMVGGWGNVDFNRATTAKRQLGSTWKLLLFEAALQLGWTPTDALDNRRAVFPYQTTFYYPRPDHTGAPERVSIGWAAARSENLATIWLLDHLSDPLTPAQFRALAARVGLVPAKGESGGEWVKRVQEAGVLPTRGKLLDGLFRSVWSQDIAPDLLFEGREGDVDIGRSLHYGFGFEAERAVVRADRSLTASEKAARLEALDRSFLSQESLAEQFTEARRALLAGAEVGRMTDGLLAGFSARSGAEGTVELHYGGALAPGFEPLTVARVTRLVEPDEPAPDAPPGTDEEASVWDDVEPASAREPSAVPAETAEEITARRRRKPGPDGGEFAPEPVHDRRNKHLERIRGDAGSLQGERLAELLSPERVRLGGMLTPGLVARTRSALTAAMDGFGEDPDLYSFDALSRVRDFQLLVHLEYLRMLARRSGVQSEIAPVMSMPLGSSDITLLEAAMLYQGMVTGRTHRFYADALTAAPFEPGNLAAPLGDSSPRRDGISVVREVSLADGTVIYRTARESSPLHSPGVSAELQGLLRAVVTHGTGRRAAQGAPLTSQDPARAAELARRKAVLPLFGKTGTTNSYKNSAFVGFVPDLGDPSEGPPGSEHLRWGMGQVVAAYVGYDDNREMRNGSVRLAGASGSLPAWLGTALAVGATGDVGDRVDLVDLDFANDGTLPVTWPDDVGVVRVDASTGLPLDGDGEGPGDTATLIERRDGGVFEPIAPGID